MPNGLFWTIQVPNPSYRVHANGRSTLELKNLPLVDSFQAFSGEAIPSMVDVSLTWNAIGPAESRGLGTAGDDSAFNRFAGQRAPALCSGTVQGIETGFSFRTQQLTSGGFPAYVGTERNGSYL